MKPGRYVLAVATLLLVPSLLRAQSLGEAARKERERRKKNQETGVKARTIGEQEVRTYEAPSGPPAPEPESPAAEEAAASSGPAGRTPLDEQQWRYRVSQARRRLEQAKKRAETLAGLSLVPGEYYVDENNRPVITSLGQLQRLVQEANSELAAAQKGLDDLLEEARRAGVPPGWLR